jgi:hypothetical protein
MAIYFITFINCSWPYVRWQCYKNWTYIQEMDTRSKETKHTSHEKAARTSHEETAHLTKFNSTVQVQRTEYKVQ